MDDPSSTSLRPDTRPPAAGDHLGPYRLQRLIGHGASGNVYLATDGQGTESALKVLNDSDRAYDDLAGVRHARNVAQHSVYLLPILHVEANASPAWYSMPLAQSLAQPGQPYAPRTLEDLLQAGPLPFEKVLHIGQRLLLGLMDMHTQSQLAHCDIKPTNVFWYGDDWRLGDFGSTRPFGQIDPLLTHRLYQLPDHPSNAAWDLAQVARVLYRCLTGDPEDADLFEKFKTADLSHLDRRADALRKIILRAWDTIPSHRYPDTASMLLDLRGLEPPPPPPPPPLRLLHPLLPILIVAALALGAWWAFHDRGQLHPVSTQLRPDGTVEVIVRNSAGRQIQVKEVIIVIIEETPGTRRATPPLAGVVIPLDDLAPNQPRALPAALTVPPNDKASLLLSPQTGRLLKLKATLIDDQGNRTPFELSLQ